MNCNLTCNEYESESRCSDLCFFQHVCPFWNNAEPQQKWNLEDHRVEGNFQCTLHFWICKGFIALPRQLITCSISDSAADRYHPEQCSHIWHTFRWFTGNTATWRCASKTGPKVAGSRIMLAGLRAPCKCPHICLPSGLIWCTGPQAERDVWNHAAHILSVENEWMVFTRFMQLLCVLTCQELFQNKCTFFFLFFFFSLPKPWIPYQVLTNMSHLKRIHD